ncbi:hypothetical protein B0H14DRAFT_2612347 [Mycena olivaceomarginata]|nr:hypothetical protein B0H14DRAFT_2612347 [Mycena olivaceomarginata]
MYKEWRQCSGFLFPPPISPSHRVFDFVGGQTLLGLNPMASPPTLRPQGHQSRPSMFRKSRPQESHPALTCQPTSYFLREVSGGLLVGQRCGERFNAGGGETGVVMWPAVWDGGEVGFGRIGWGLGLGNTIFRVNPASRKGIPIQICASIRRIGDMIRYILAPKTANHCIDYTCPPSACVLSVLTMFATLARCPDVALPQSHSGRCREARSDSATKQTDEFIPPPLAGGSFWVVRRMNPSSEYEMRRSASGWQWRAHLDVLFGAFCPNSRLAGEQTAGPRRHSVTSGST